MRLFFFGSLLDPELFEVVVGRPVASVVRVPARLDGWSARRVREEDYPVLVPTAGSGTVGRVIAGLSWTEIDRVQFFEGDEYDLSPVTVEVPGPEAASVLAASPLPGHRPPPIRPASGAASGAVTGTPPADAAPVPLTAHAYLSNGSLSETAEPWRLDQWQRRHKVEAVALARRWMALYGRLPLAEAEIRWEAIVAEARATLAEA